MARLFTKKAPINTNKRGPWCWQCKYSGQLQLCQKHGHELDPYSKCKDFKTGEEAMKWEKGVGTLWAYLKKALVAEIERDGNFISAHIYYDPRTNKPWASMKAAREWFDSVAAKGKE